MKPIPTRKCPKCDNEITYNSRHSYLHANRKNRMCIPCGVKATSGSNNGMYGRSYYDVWVEKYGKDEAERRNAVKSAKASLQCSGSGNPMYGRPTPQGAGNGWKGWYRGIFFRSLLEVAYIIKVIEVNNWTFTNGEEIRIPYVGPLGSNRTYSPDYVVNNSMLIECKPKRLWRTPSVAARATAGAAYALSVGLVYEMVEPPRLTNEEITQLYDSGQIVFTEKYDRMYRERYANKATLDPRTPEIGEVNTLPEVDGRPSTTPEPKSDS